MGWPFENSRMKDYRYGLWLLAHNAELIPIVRFACTQARYLERQHGSLQSNTQNHLRVVDDTYEAPGTPTSLNDVVDELEKVEALNNVVAAWKEARNVYFYNSENLLDAVNAAAPMAAKSGSWLSLFAPGDPADVRAAENVTSSVKAQVRSIHDLKAASADLLQRAINHTADRMYQRNLPTPYSLPHNDPIRLDFDHAAHALSNFYSHPLGRIKKHPRRLARELKRLEERSQFIPR